MIGLPLSLCRGAALGRCWGLAPAVGLLMGLAACGSPPLDLSNDEWNRLTPAQQSLALEKQAEIDRMSQTLGARAQQGAALTALSESTRAARVARRQDLGRLGDTLDCTIDTASASFGSNAFWTATADKGFRIVRGDSQPVTIQARGGADDRMTLYADYAESGMVLRLCAVPPAGPGVPAPVDQCATVAAPFQAFRDGITRVIEVPARLSGNLHCAFAPGAPARVIEIGETLETQPHPSQR